MMPITNEAAKIHLVTSLADALKATICASRGGQWCCTASTLTVDMGDPAAVDVLVMSLQLRGTLHGEVLLAIDSKEAKGLFVGREDHPADVEASWRMLMDDLVHRLPKRASDAGMFAFSVETHRLMREHSEDGLQIGQIELARLGNILATFRVRADEELVQSLQVSNRNLVRTRERGKPNEPLAPELNRVIDVPLSVTLRFGQRNMRLRDVLELNSGALIEDPVDLVLDDRVIARGEVVIVDGNYGLRVTEIVERHPAVVF